MTATAPAEPRLCLPPKPMTRAPRVRLPAGAVDCHVHVFAEGAPLALPRSYTPHVLTIADWRAYAQTAGIAKGVLVQPSVYGFDNSAMLVAIAESPDTLRGIAVVPVDIDAAELRRLHAGGVRGIRCNTRNLGGLSFDAVEALAKKIAPLGWCLQFQVRREQLAPLAALVPSLGVPVVLDHIGFIDPSDDAARDDVMALLDAGGCVKISAPYRLSRVPRYEDVGAMARVLLARHPDRLLWGSDWPHTELWADVPEDAELIDTMSDWFAGEDVRHRVFADTPERLFFST